MSLINDALKQASRSSKNASAAHSGAAGGLRPANAPRPGGGKKVVLSLFFLAVLGGAGWFLWQGWQARNPNEPFTLANFIEAAKSIGSPKSAPATTQPPATAASNAAETAPAPLTTPAPATEPKPQGNFLTRVLNKQQPGADGDGGKGGAFPPVKVQGIYYRAGDSSVLINGKNLAEGEEIDGVTIAKIERQSVTLEFHGQSREIKLR